MSAAAKLWTAAWVAALLVSAIFILSILVALVIAPFRETPAALLAVNAFMMPWGVLAILLAFLLRRIAQYFIRKEPAHGR